MVPRSLLENSCMKTRLYGEIFVLQLTAFALAGSHDADTKYGKSLKNIDFYSNDKFFLY